MINDLYYKEIQRKLKCVKITNNGATTAKSFKTMGAFYSMEYNITRQVRQSVKKVEKKNKHK